MDRKELKKKLRAFSEDDEFNMIDLANLIKKRLRNDWDIYISLEGRTGSGKSTLAVLLGLLVDSHFTIKDNMCLLPDATEIRDKFNKVQQYGLVVVDEAAKTLHKYGWHDKGQQSIVEMGNTERYQNKAVLLCMPLFSDLSSSFRRGRVDVRIWIPERGRAMIFLRHDDKDIEDPWHTKENLNFKQKQWRILRAKGASIVLGDNEKHLRIERKSPNYGFEFRYPDIKEVLPEIHGEYVKAKEDSRDYEMPQEESVSPMVDKYRDRLEKAIILIRERIPKIKNKELCKLIGIPKSTLSDIIHRTKKSEIRSEEEFNIISMANGAPTPPKIT